MIRRFIAPIYLTIILITVGVIPTTKVTAEAIVPLNFTADGSGRFTDHFSNAYAVVDPAAIGLSSTAFNGFYTIGTTNLVGLGITAFDEGDWRNIGSVTLSGTPTGNGTESFGITAADFDFNRYIDGETLSIANAPYTTLLSNVSGTVEFTSGVVDNITLTSDVAFTFAGFDSFDGTFNITNNNFDLQVDETVTTVFGGVRQEWDFTGTVTAVPEPGTWAALVVAGGVLVWRQRRRV